MKLKFFAIITILSVLGITAAIIISNWDKHLIYLSNGEIIEAEKTWVILDEVFYEKGAGTLFTVKTEAVDEIVNGGFSSIDDWKTIISHAMESRQGVFGILMSQMTWLICLAILCLFSSVVLIRFILSKRTHAEEESDEDELITISISPQIDDSEKIVIFFLNIYLMQLRGKRTDRYHYRQTDIRGFLNTTVFDLRVNIDDQWQSRRISLGRIGEDSSARSKCFYVIFDDHLVVKIPPEPVTDFNQYIESIKADRRIADILAPRECLVPRLSIVLKRIPSFAKIMGKLTGDDEDTCVEALNLYPKFQDFLKSSGSFVFYMDLSKYFFLGQILNECHDANAFVKKELKNYQEMIWTPEAFTDRYGEDAADLCFDLQNVFALFNGRINDNSIPEFQKKEWFATIFQDKKPSEKAKKIPYEAEAALAHLKDQHAGILNAYKRLLQKAARKQAFKQNLSRIQSISSRLVELLAWLFFKDVAIRDLKPDNLLVAGNPSKYPVFLASPEDFEIGLIDVEIAAYVGAYKGGMDQPKLGWTTFYATPSHMFVNEIIKELFDDVSYILKLQDWYAIVAIVYEAVTGEKLFVNTAGIIASMAGELPRHLGERSKMILFAKTGSATFWKTATCEFESRIAENADALKAVHIEILDDVDEMFQAAAGKSGQESIRRQLAGIKSKISAYDLMGRMFYHVREMMVRASWLDLVSMPHPGSPGNAGADEKTQVM
ncbi:MAG: hypothetical protein C4518_09395 [Desulfobacteraceae bacterium]|nr:MAG: hypothetical protein C4518_09395 [Desulfobacteraceae bacterium]